MRRRKNDKDRPEPEEADAEVQSEENDPLDERLAPIEEFRGKADQWMKETSAQLARVATHVQQDEKRQHKLDERLAEFEERIQGMLTLTEALSQGDNPFVRPAGAPPLQKSHAASPEKERKESDEAHPARPARAERQVPSARTPAPSLSPVADDPDQDGSEIALSDEVGSGRPLYGREEEGEPVPTRLVRPYDGDVDGPEDADEDLLGDDEMEAPRSEPEPDDPFQGKRSHPNDAHAEDVQPFTLDDSWSPPDGEPHVSREAGIRPLTSSAPLDPDAAEEAERRLILLQWASLLSHHLTRIEVDPFLETYLRTRWIDHREVEQVRALVVDLGRDEKRSSDPLEREQVHIRSVLLLSRLASAKNPRKAPPKARVAEERVLKQAGWLQGVR